MLRFSTWVISLLILSRTILAEDSVWYDKLYPHASHDRVHTSRTGRFGFDFLENLRKNFCQSWFCMSADNMPYFINLICAIKCPELYLPHHPTPENITSISTSILTTSSATIKTTAVPATPAKPPVAIPAAPAEPPVAVPAVPAEPPVAVPVAPAQPPAGVPGAPAQPPAGIPGAPAQPPAGVPGAPAQPPAVVPGAPAQSPAGVPAAPAG